MHCRKPLPKFKPHVGNNMWQYLRHQAKNVIQVLRDPTLQPGTHPLLLGLFVLYHEVYIQMIFQWQSYRLQDSVVFRRNVNSTRQRWLLHFVHDEIDSSHWYVKECYHDCTSSNLGTVYTPARVEEKERGLEKCMQFHLGIRRVWMTYWSVV